MHRLMEMKTGIRTERSIAGLALVAMALATLGCGTFRMTADPPMAISGPSIENARLRAECIGKTKLLNKDVLIVRLENKSSEAIAISGDSGACLPTLGNNKACLMYRDHAEDAAKGATLGASLQDGLFVEMPKAGPRTLEPGESTAVFVQFEMAGDSRELAVDLKPLVAEGSVHDAEGNLDTLYLTIPIDATPTLAEKARRLIRETKFGFQLTSNDVMN